MIQNIDRVPVEVASNGAARYGVYDAAGVLIRYEYIKREDGASVTGTPINKLKLDELLAASGTTAGTSTALTLAQDGFVLADGALVAFKLHTEIGASPTLNANSTGAKSIVDDEGTAIDSSAITGAWLAVRYSGTLDAYVLAGSVPGSLLDRLDDIDDLIAGLVPSMGVNVFTSSGTFTVPATSVYKVTVVGGGGTGGEGYSSQPSSSGGAGGGTAIKFVSLAKDATVAVTVGGASGTSSFGAHCSATGGEGGGYDGSLAEIVAAGQVTGGVGSGGDVNLYGADGGFAEDYFQGAGGSSMFGHGGRGGLKAGTIGYGEPGKGYGAGGGGSYSSSTTKRAGGTGSNGIVIVERVYI